MLRLPPFEHLSPRNIDEAVEMLARYKGDTLLVAGGTDVYPGMKRGICQPKRLVSMGKVPELQKMSVDQDGVTLGAGLTLAQIAEHPLLLRKYPALACAAISVATSQIRNMGTLGGNLCLDTRCTYYNQSQFWRDALGYCLKKDGKTCWVAPGLKRCVAVHSSDMAPILIALGARVRLVGPGGERWLSLEVLYRDDGIQYLSKKSTEILTEIRVPRAPGVRMTYQKLRRRGAFDFPVMSIAVAMRQDTSGRCENVRIVLGAIASAPIRVEAAEASLLGKQVDADVIERAATAVYQVAKPLDATDMTVAYRKRMARVYTTRALRLVTMAAKDA